MEEKNDEGEERGGIRCAQSVMVRGQKDKDISYQMLLFSLVNTEDLTVSSSHLSD